MSVTLQQLNNDLANYYQKMIKIRIQITEKSHAAFNHALEKNDFKVFMEDLAPLIRKYDQLSQLSLARRVINKLKRLGGLIL